MEYNTKEVMKIIADIKAKAAEIKNSGANNNTGWDQLMAYAKKLPYFVEHPTGACYILEIRETLGTKLHPIIGGMVGSFYFED